MSSRNRAPRRHGMQLTCREDESQTLSNISSSEQGYSLSTTTTAEITTRAIHSYTNVISYKQKNLSFHLKASKLCEVSLALESLNNVNTVDHPCLTSSSFFIFAPLTISSLLVALLLLPFTMCFQHLLSTYNGMLKTLYGSVRTLKKSYNSIRKTLLYLSKRVLG